VAITIAASAVVANIFHLDMTFLHDRPCEPRFARSGNDLIRHRHLGTYFELSGYSYGFDSQTGEYGNLVAKGIIDPTKVVRVAIQNAASVAALLITTEAMVAEVPKNAGGGMPARGGIGGMDF
jgi:hypothetical protein